MIFTAHMFSPLSKFGEFSQKFSSNLAMQLGNGQDIQSCVKKLPIVSSLYEGLQFVDFLLHKAAKDHSPIRRSNRMDGIVDGILPVSQYYGGLRTSSKKTLVERMVDPFAKYIPFDSYKDFKVIRKIENVLVPKVLAEMFTFGAKESMALEAEETLKQLKEFIFSQETWIEKEIALEDVRRVETSLVHVKNFRKTVKCDFEFTTILSGKDSKKEHRTLRQHFGGSFEFIHENGRWIATSFSYSPLNWGVFSHYSIAT